MNSIKWNRVLYIILFLTAITSWIIWLCGDRVFSLKFVSDCIEKSATVIVVCSWLFCYKLWKCKIFQKWLVLIPDLNGEWSGVISSNWIDPETNAKKAVVDVTLIIKQSLFKTSCVLNTQESTSHSIVANFLIDEENQINKLVYTYQNEPNQILRERSAIHYGTAALKINYCGNQILLNGNYWTDRGSSGKMDFSHKKKEETHGKN